MVKSIATTIRSVENYCWLLSENETIAAEDRHTDKRTDWSQISIDNETSHFKVVCTKIKHKSTSMPDFHIKYASFTYIQYISFTTTPCVEG